MAEGADTRRDSGGQWPVAVTLVLCALFLAAIAIKLKSDHDSYRARAVAEATAEAEVAASRVRDVLVNARATIVAGARVSGVDAAGLASGIATVTSVGAFDPEGVMASPESVAPADIRPMSAAAQLATDSGWTGAVARGDGTFVPAISVRAADGGTIVAFLSLAGIEPSRPGRRLVIAGGGGALVAVNPARGFPASGDVNATLGTGALSAAEPGAVLSQQSDGTRLVVGAAPAVPGLTVYVARDRAGLDAAWMRTLLFYCLLFLGPVLTFSGVFFLVRGQADRFAVLRAMTRDAERRLRIAIDGARCGVWDWDLTDDRVYMTQLMARIFGLEGAGRFDGEEVAAALGDDDRRRLRAALQAAIRIGTVDIILTVPGGEEPRRVHLRGRAAHDKTNPGVVRAIGVAIDVTEQVVAPATQTPTVATVEPARHGAHSPPGPNPVKVLEALPGACAIWDSDNKLVACNQAFKTLFALGEDVAVSGADYAIVSRTAAAAVTPNGTRADPVDHAEVIELKSGIWLKLLEKQTADGGLVSFAMDITRQKADEERLLRSERQTRSVVGELERAEREAADLAEKYNSARLRAEQASSAKSNFLANMSHELRTPLTAIIGFSEMMRRQMHGPLGHEQYESYAQSIHESGEHLLALIVDVLDMAKIEAGKFEIHPKPTYVDELVDQAVRMCSTRADQRNVEIEVDTTDIGQATVDPRAVKQVLINLIGNAVKFTPEGGRVLVQTRGTVKDITLRIVDTGIGIAPEDLERLGRPFEQVDNDHSRAHEGTGLGLALCRSFVSLHHGTFDISSEVGVGTMVTVTLPRHSMSARDVA